MLSLGRLCNELVECSIEKLRIRGRSKVTLSEKQKWRTPCLICSKLFTEGFQEYDAVLRLHVIEEQPLEDKPPSVVTDAGGGTLAKESKSEKGIIGPQPRGNHNVFTHYPKDPNCEVCKMTKTTRARCRIKPKKRVDGIAFSTIWRPDHGRSHNSERGKRVKVWTQKFSDPAR